MSDPFTDPNASPWTRGGDPVQLGPAVGDPGQAPPAFVPPAAPDGWSQPPPPEPGQWDQPPDQPPQWGQPAQWGQPSADQAPWGQQPQSGQPAQWGQPAADQAPWGQQPQWGQPAAGQAWGQPQPPSSSKVVWIVIAVVVVLVVGIIGAAALVVSSARGGVEGFLEEVGELDPFDDAEGLPEGPRLLDAAGSVGGGNDVQRFDITIPDRTLVQIDVVGRDGFDTVVVLLDSDGGELGRDDDSGQGLSSRLSRELSSGRYTIEVSGFGDGSGAFQVIVTDL